MTRDTDTAGLTGVALRLLECCAGAAVMFGLPLCLPVPLVDARGAEPPERTPARLRMPARADASTRVPQVDSSPSP